MLDTFPPQYLYQEYNDDPDLQALTSAFNNYAQAYLNAMNALNLPIYTNLPTGSTVLTITEDGSFNTVLNNSIPYDGSGSTSVGGNTVVGLLAWVLSNLYGIPRPILGSVVSSTMTGCLYNTFKFNTRQFNQHTLTKNYTYSTASDDVYQRTATWNLYKGDGFQFTARWLKRRVSRFLNGANGIDPGIDRTYGVGVQYLPNYKIQINCNSGAPGAAFIPSLAQLVASGALSLPFQYTYTVVSV